MGETCSASHDRPFRVYNVYWKLPSHKIANATQTSSEFHLQQVSRIAARMASAFFYGALRDGEKLTLIMPMAKDKYQRARSVRV